MEEPEQIKVIRIGAEAVVSRLRWNGFDLVSKHRVPKPYRIPELDRRIRDKRTLHEAKIIVELKKAGVPAPAIMLLDRSSSTIYMQYINGIELKRALDELDPIKIEKIARRLGEIIGKMHLKKIVHGDLTTSNIILDKSEKIYLIDFGLSSVTDDVEELAVDIHLLDRSLESAHHKIRERFMKHFLIGYSKIVGKNRTLEILRKVKEIRMRGRYVERSG
ncbi:MAG: Kae1-associated kinase Bud32 [Thaumarchaeota archaeon]|nr:MAG: Kae1-associated kinase Bud32 [Nitrososphaerota archaeon]